MFNKNLILTITIKNNRTRKINTLATERGVCHVLTSLSCLFACHTVLSSSKGSKSSSLPGSGVLVWAPARLALLLRVWQGVAGGVGLSGMNRATRNATTTVQAPRKNGGPGIVIVYARKQRWGKWLQEELARCGTQVRMMMYLSGVLERDGIVRLDWCNAVQFDIEEEENETVECRTQTITETSNTSDHPLYQS